MLTEINFHRIANVEIQKTRVLSNSRDGQPFTTRDIILTDNRGKTFGICLFGNTHKDLVMHREN